MRTLRFELKRAFTNPLFFVASFISIGIIVCHIVFSVIPDSAEQGMYLETVRHPLNVQPLDRRLARLGLSFDVFLPAAALSNAAARQHPIFRQKNRLQQPRCAARTFV
ncbi:MAG: hypothetical protein ACLT98_10085 [Eggerthellaceae bacterium]